MVVMDIIVVMGIMVVVGIMVVMGIMVMGVMLTLPPLTCGIKMLILGQCVDHPFM